MTGMLAVYLTTGMLTMMMSTLLIYEQYYKKYYEGGKRVYHCKSWRKGTVQNWKSMNWKRGQKPAWKVWILFDDGYEEFRWAHKFWTLQSADDYWS